MSAPAPTRKPHLATTRGTRPILGHLRRHWRLMTLLLVLALAAGLDLFLFLRPLYTSRASVRLDERELSPEAKALPPEQRVRRAIKELTEPVLIERTARRFGVDAGAEKIRQRHLPKMKVRSTGAQELEIDLATYSAEWSTAWSTALIDEALAMRRERHGKERTDAINALVKDLAASVGRPEPFVRDSFAVSTTTGLKAALVEMQRRRAIPALLAPLDERIEELERSRTALENTALDPIQQLALLAAMNRRAAPDGEPATETWPALEEELTALEAELADATETNTDGDLRLVGLILAREEIDEKIAAELAAARARFTTLSQALLDRKTKLEADRPVINETRYQDMTLEHLALQIQAENLAWETKFQKMAQTIAGLEALGERPPGGLDFGKLLAHSDGPVSPNPLVFALVSLLVGALLVGTVPFAVSYLDRKMSNLGQVEAAFGLPGLGIVPKIEGPTLIAPGREARSGIVDHFHLIRSRLGTEATSGEASRFFMVTSALPNEGKTVVSANLAIAFSQIGARTLLIDADLWRGRMHRLFGLRKSPGLSDVLLEDQPLDPAIRPTAHENLSVLTAGKHREAGAKLFTVNNFPALLATLRERFDCLVIDTPPVLGLAETDIIQRHVDGVLFVIPNDRMPLRTIQAALDKLRSHGAKLYGFVLNRFDLRTGEPSVEQPQ